jgi:hypothetical protein
VLALYFEATLDKRNVWLKALDPYVNSIGKQTGMQAVSGIWGEKWAWLATNLDSEPITPEHFSNILAYFIQAAYIPNGIALKVTDSF